MWAQVLKGIHDGDQQLVITALGDGFSVEDDAANGGGSLLHHACTSANVPAATLLLAHGWERLLDVPDKDGYYPLSLATKLGNKPLVLLFLAAGAKVNLLDWNGHSDTAIIEAIKAQHQQIAELLLLAGADPTILGWQNQSAVNIAIDIARANGTAASRQLARLLLAHLSTEFAPVPSSTLGSIITTG